MAMDENTLTALMEQAFACTLMMDIDGACEALDTIGTTGDPRDVYRACCGFAEVGKRAMMRVIPRPADPTDGGMWALAEARPGANEDDPYGTFAMRFIVAYANDDRDTCMALFKAAMSVGGDHFTRCVSVLLIQAAQMCRSFAVEAPS